MHGATTNEELAQVVGIAGQTTYSGIYFKHSMMTSIFHKEMLRNRRRAIKETFKQV